MNAQQLSRLATSRSRQDPSDQSGQARSRHASFKCREFVENRTSRAGMQSSAQAIDHVGHGSLDLGSFLTICQAAVQELRRPILDLQHQIGEDDGGQSMVPWLPCRALGALQAQLTDVGCVHTLFLARTGGEFQKPTQVMNCERLVEAVV
mmetsp:Transcript_45080/g.86757  ORF Transcript_45080/g.86757 Transcript_45080/m.86757 type:complete len:150 (-) Transcript_45080:249-698(-)